MDNLVACCHDCHVRRPEHYWIEVPDGFFDPTVHSRTPMPRTTVKLVPKPPCIICGKPVTWKRNRCCSVACANTLKWQSGIYEERTENIKAAAAQRNTRICVGCGNTFYRRYGRYCSRSCFLASPTGAPGKGKARPPVPEGLPLFDCLVGLRR
jgi:hypothetical protein